MENVTDISILIRIEGELSIQRYFMDLVSSFKTMCFDII